MNEIRSMKFGQCNAKFSILALQIRMQQKKKKIRNREFPRLIFYLIITFSKSTIRDQDFKTF